MGEWWQDTSRWLLGQLLWSKTRLIAVLVVVAGGLVFLLIPPDVPFLVTSDSPLPTTTPTPTVMPQPATPAPAADSSPSPGEGFGVPAEDTDDQAAAAAAFLAVYLAPPDSEDGRQAWVDNLEPVTGSVLLSGLEVTRFDALPVGTPGDFDWTTVGDTYSEANVPVSDGTLLRLQVRADPAGVWRVTDVRPIDTEGV